MPWVHLHIDTNGLVRACCDANITFGNIRDQTVLEIWNSESIRKFRMSLMEGKHDARCSSCFSKEDAGKNSMRTETLEKFASKLNWVDQTDEDGYSEGSQPVYLDIRFNNLCNLRCRTCWHGASSSWFEEAKTLRNNRGSKAVIEATNDSSWLIDQLLSAPFDLEEIYFAGGEPLMMAEHYDLLERLIEIGNTDVHLRYNTNLSKLNLKKRSVLDLWRKFDKVTVSASIDGLGRQVEYVRKGLKWESFVENMHVLKTELPHVELEIAPTISVFNVTSIGGLHRYFVEEGLISINAIYLNVLSRPDYYNIRVLPKELKQKAQVELTKHMQWMELMGVKKTLIDEFEAVINFMNQKDLSKHLPKLKKNLVLLDEMRSECFQDTFPELRQVLDHA